MPSNLSRLLTVGVSSSALFNLEEEDRIFKSQGLQPFIDYQRNHEDAVLAPGSAFPLIKGLLGLNAKLKNGKVDVILMSRNHPDVSLRVFNSIGHYQLEMPRAALTGGAQLGPYLGAFKVDLFLSQSAEDVQSAADQGVAAALIYSPPPELQTAPKQIRIAFDGDCVIFSSEAQDICDQHGLEAFFSHETANAQKELPPGPFAKLVRILSDTQGADPENSPVRIALVTDRSMPAHERAIRTLREWNVRIDEAYFLGGIAKTDIIKAFGAHMFFDDKEEYCKLAASQVPTGRVLLPTARKAAIEISVSVETENQFLSICKTYLKGEFRQSETELKEWFHLNLEALSQSNLSTFLTELEESVRGTPPGSQRRAATAEDTAKAKLLTFLEELLAKQSFKC